MRLAEAEAKLKTEIARIKKKYQAQITELEMSLDAANKQNMDLQKIIKKQSMQITVSTTMSLDLVVPCTVVTLVPPLLALCKYGVVNAQVCSTRKCGALEC